MNEYSMVWLFFCEKNSYFLKNVGGVILLQDNTLYCIINTCKIRDEPTFKKSESILEAGRYSSYGQQYEYKGDIQCGHGFLH